MPGTVKRKEPDRKMKAKSFPAFLLLLLIAVQLLCAVTASADKSVLLTFTGDCTIGSEEDRRREPDSFVSVVKKEGYAYPFARFLPLFSQDDCTVINLEGVLSDSREEEKTSKAYRFRGDTVFTAVLTEGSVEACSLANNHISDFGRQGILSTQEALSAAGIGWFRNTTPWIFEKDGIRIAFFSVNETTYFEHSEELRREMVRMKEDGEVSAVVVCYHSGREYTARHYNIQEERSNTLVRFSADLVITNHPHVVQGIKIVSNRTVCYSLGNFVFGGNREIRYWPYGNRILTSRYCLVVQARLDFDDDGTYLGQQIILYPAFTSDDPQKNNYQPYPVHGEDAATVIDAAQFDTDFQIPEVTEAEDYPYVMLPYLPAEKAD